MNDNYTAVDAPNRFIESNGRKLAYRSIGSGKPLVVPGNSSASPLTAVLSGARKDIAMPDRHRLPEKQLAVVSRWIDEGAAWPGRPGGK